jgi:hypothetical protein
MAADPTDRDWVTMPTVLAVGDAFRGILHGRPSDPDTDQAVLRTLNLHGLYGEWLGLLPAESLTRRWRDDLRAVHLTAMRVAASSATASQALTAADIPHVVYKGVAMAAQMGVDWRLRQSGDVDVLVPPESIPAALAALRDVGWDGGSQAPGRTHFWAGCEVTLTGAAVEVDLHWRPNVSPLALHIPVADLIRDGETIPLGGTTLPTLSAEHSALVTITHGGRSMWWMGKWILDLARTVASVDPAMLRRRAAQAGAQKSLALGCAALVELDPASVPPVLRPGPGASALWGQMSRRPISVFGRGFLKSRSADSLRAEVDAFSRLAVQRLLPR